MKYAAYDYYSQLLNHLDSDESIFFNGEFIYPKQLEIHLPGNHKIPCNLHCSHCQGRKYIRTISKYWELDALELVNKLEGNIPFHIYGGAYTEPLLNPYLMTFLSTTKKYNNHFGIHTNGSLLYQLDKTHNWLSELNRISTDNVDYLSISLDAGSADSWAASKKTKHSYLFDDILKAIEKACKLQTDKSHAIRLCYLISDETSSEEELKYIIDFAKKNKIDSLRFSIPYAVYTQSFDLLKEYKKDIEVPNHIKYYNILRSYLSKSNNEKPFIFYVNPETTSYDQYDFDKCVYSYFQITLGADGNFYRCSAIAAPTAKHAILGSITPDLDNFKKVVMSNYNENWNCKTMCFDKGLRCNRQAIIINKKYKDYLNK